MEQADKAFLQSLETGAIPNQAFHHRDHLKAAFLYVRLRGAAGAEQAMLEMIRRFAESHSHAPKSHFTLTAVWVKLVAAHATRHRDVSFDQLIDLDDRLLDKDLPLRFYSHTVLFSERARAQWVNPDGQSLPTVA